MIKGKKQTKKVRLDLAAGDPVIVVAGKDQGKRGEVLRTLPKTGQIVVRGANLLKRHVKSGQSKGGTRAIQGGIVDFEAPLDYSNVQLVCPACGKPTRLRHVVLDDGKKALACARCGEAYERIRRQE